MANGHHGEKHYFYKINGCKVYKSVARCELAACADACCNLTPPRPSPDEGGG
jgi:hypothetical protein